MTRAKTEKRSNADLLGEFCMVLLSFGLAPGRAAAQHSNLRHALWNLESATAAMPSAQRKRIMDDFNWKRIMDDFNDNIDVALLRKRDAAISTPVWLSNMLSTGVGLGFCIKGGLVELLAPSSGYEKLSDIYNDKLLTTSDVADVFISLLAISLLVMAMNGIVMSLAAAKYNHKEDNEDLHYTPREVFMRTTFGNSAKFFHHLGERYDEWKNRPSEEHQNQQGQDGGYEKLPGTP